MDFGDELEDFALPVRQLFERVFLVCDPSHGRVCEESRGQVGAKQWSVATISLDELRAAMERAEARYLSRTA